jgi:hypothetical protein
MFIQWHKLWILNRLISESMSLVKLQIHTVSSSKAISIIRYPPLSWLRLKCDDTRAGTRIRLWAKWTSPFKSGGALVQSTTGSRGVHINDSNAGYTMFRGSVRGTGYLFHSPFSPSLPPPVRHRVPSRLNWTLQNFNESNHVLSTLSLARPCRIWQTFHKKN